MWILFVALLAQQTPQAPVAADTVGAYLDPGARALVQRARERRGTTDAGIRAYDALVKQRLSVGLKAMRRDRLLLAQDEVARIHWRRDEATRVEIVGARQSTPMFTRGFSLPDDLKHPGELVFEPTDDRLRLGFIDSSFVRHPISPGSERYYRFQSGDTTTFRLPDGRAQRVVELRVIPRRDDVHLLRGSLWIDAATSGVVRGLFRLAADFDLERDADPGDRNDMKDVPGVLKPIRAELRYLTLEYGLVDFRWWMPRLIAVEGSAHVGALASIPFRYERVYSQYELTADTGGIAVAVAPSPKHVRLANCRQTPRSITISTREAPQPGTQPRDTAHVLSCDCYMSDCRIFEIHIPNDTLALLASAELPPPPASAYDEQLITESQLADIGARLGILPSQPWRMGAPTLHFGLGRAGLVRYNRVEGLSVGARVGSDFGPVAAELTARLGAAAAPADSPRAVRFTPDVALALVRPGLRNVYTLSGFRRTEAMDPAGRPLGFGNSFNALLFGRDDGDYFRAAGAELARRAPEGTDEHVTWRLFAQRERPLPLNTQLSMRRIFGSGPTFRPNLQAEAADEAGAALSLRWTRGVASDASRWGLTLSADGAAGTFDYTRPSATVQLGFPLPFGLVASAEGGAGTSTGTVPVQHAWFLGGPASLRGYAGDVMYGQAFWRGRAEVGTSFPAARLAVFSDAGWAGARDEFARGRPLLSVGAGASFLDGYVRMDLARALRAPTGWRLDLYLDALL